MGAYFLIMCASKSMIYKIANRTRKWLEKESRKIAKRFGKEDSFFIKNRMCGLCAIASAELWRRLNKHGIKSKICLSDCHAFVLYKPYLIDITATQFNDYRHKRVVIINHLEARIFYYYWNYNQILDSDKDCRQQQIELQWPYEQLAEVK